MLLYTHAMNSPNISGIRDLPAAIACGRASKAQFLWALGFGASLIAATDAVRWLGDWAPLRYLAAALPLVTGFFYMRAVLLDCRRQTDELQLRICLEAAAISVCGLVVVMLTYPLLEKVALVGPLDYSVVLGLLGLLLAAGYLNALRRYR